MTERGVPRCCRCELDKGKEAGTSLSAITHDNKVFFWGLGAAYRRKVTANASRLRRLDKTGDRTKH